MSRGDPQFNLRIPTPTLDALRAVASVNQRSLTEIINRALQKDIDLEMRDARARLQVRLPLELHASLKERARKNRNSLNAEIVRALEKAIES
jgi:predicted HicB family RNase H-like nuclease